MSRLSQKSPSFYNIPSIYDDMIALLITLAVGESSINLINQHSLEF
jgi:hypothetical protein